MITEYEVVSEHDLSSLKSKVKGLIALGWQPFASLAVSGTMVAHTAVPLYTQVMVKHDSGTDTIQP